MTKWFVILAMVTWASCAQAAELARLEMQDDAASTTVVDDVGTDGTLTNAGNTEDVSEDVGPGGGLAKAFHLDGTDDHIDSNDLDVAGNNALYISVWFNLDSGVSNVTLCSGDANDDVIRIRTNEVQIRIDDANAEAAWDSTISTQQWYHLVVTRPASGGDWAIFLDGVEQTATRTGNSLNFAVDKIGDGPGASFDNWDGYLAGFVVGDEEADQTLVDALFDEGASAPEITYNSGNPATINFDEGLVTTAVATMTADGAGITWSLTGTDAADFSIDSSTGVITAANALDYESPQDDDTDNSYSVTAQATNAGGSDTIALTIDVQDVTPKINVVRVAIPTTGDTTFDVTSTGSGVAEQQRAIMLFYNVATTDGTAAADAMFGYGFAVGSGQSDPLSQSNVADQLSASGRMLDNDSTNVDGHSETYNSGAHMITENGTPPPASNTENTIEYDSAITDGIRLTTGTQAPGGAYLLQAVLFSGDIDAAIYLCPEDPDGGSGGTEDYTISFEPELIIGFSNADNFAGSPVGTHQQYCAQHMTFFHNDKAGTVTEAGQAVVFEMDDATNTNTYGHVADDIMPLIDPTDDTTTLEWEFNISFPATTTLRVTTTLQGGDNAELAFLLLDFDDYDAEVGVADFPTSTGSQAITLGSLTPEFAMFQVNRITALNTDRMLDAEAGTMGFAATDGTNEFCATQSCEYDVATSNSQSLSDDQLFAIPADDGTDVDSASFTSFGNGSVTVNVTDAASSAYKMPFFVIGNESSTAIPIFQHQE